MQATCLNCRNRSETGCILAMKPRDGDVLCDRYAMSDTFREKVMDLLRKDLEREVNMVLLRFRVEQVDAFAG